MKRFLPLAFLFLLPAAPLRAQAYLTPSIGVAFAGDTDDSKITYAGSLTFAGEDSSLGFAIDFGYTPDFLGSTGIGNNNATTLMGNLVLISPGQRRIYLSAGVGLLKTRVEDIDGFFEVDSNELGLNVGAGVLLLSNGSIGLQADVRYFRNLTDPEPDDEFDVDLGDLNFWRATGGIVIRF